MNARGVITEMIEVLNRGDREAEMLWDIITALRGPDDANSSAKYLTTASIRGAIGLDSHVEFAIVSNRTPVFSDGPLSDINGIQMSMNSDPAFSTKTFGNTHYHFVAHYVRALRALQELGYLPKSPSPSFRYEPLDKPYDPQDDL